MRYATSVPALLVAAVLSLLASGLARAAQSDITGEPSLHRIKPGSGELADRDLALGGTAFHRDAPIVVTVNSIFLRYVKERFGGNPHVLVYSEVYDDGTDNPETAHRRVVYNGESTAQDTLLGVSDRIIYGPAPFKGFPLRIKFFIVELDKQDKSFFSSLLGGLNQFAQVLSVSSAATVGQLLQVGGAINALNSDDFELRFDLTLHPPRPAGKIAVPTSPRRHDQGYYLNAPLVSGTYLVMKRETKARGGDEHDSFITNALYDNAQQTFYWSLNCDKRKVDKVGQQLRFEGGYLYRVVSESADSLKTKFGDPNTECPWVTAGGYRIPFHQRTYLAFSISPAPADAQLSAEAQREISARDMATIRGLLDKPDGPGLGAAAEAGLRQTTTMVAADVVYRDAIRRATRIADSNPDFRTSVDYPLFWISQLRTPDQGDAYEKDLNSAFNDRVLRLLGEIVPDLPPPVLGARVGATHIGCLRGIAAADLTAGKPAAGYFVLVDTARTRLGACMTPAPAPQAGAKAPQTPAGQNRK